LWSSRARPRSLPQGVAGSSLPPSTTRPIPIAISTLRALAIYQLRIECAGDGEKIKSTMDELSKKFPAGLEYTSSITDEFIHSPSMPSRDHRRGDRPGLLVVIVFCRLARRHYPIVAYPCR